MEYPVYEAATSRPGIPISATKQAGRSNKPAWGKPGHVMATPDPKMFAYPYIRKKYTNPNIERPLGL